MVFVYGAKARKQFGLWKQEDLHSKITSAENVCAGSYAKGMYKHKARIGIATCDFKVLVTCLETPLHSGSSKKQIDPLHALL